MATESKIYHGHCYCGAVSFSAKDVSDIWYCHCKQCQHLTGLYIAAAGAKREDITIKGDVNWLPISEKSTSGHCAACGSYMFWNEAARPTISILAGSFADTNGLEVKGHIFVAEKGDYYEITDGLPQFAAFPPNGTR
ncbi:GFA family protein [Litorimonas sp. RW-G-Af-16]|uniref:GFA family protein n=1 Tax=Litorimonas sp. RW-G-Af-16 TaxID=3241168 RepID=UPI00390C9C12